MEEPHNKEETTDQRITPSSEVDDTLSLVEAIKHELISCYDISFDSLNLQSNIKDLKPSLQNICDRHVKRRLLYEIAFLRSFLKETESCLHCREVDLDLGNLGKHRTEKTRKVQTEINSIEIKSECTNVIYDDDFTTRNINSNGVSTSMRLCKGGCHVSAKANEATNTGDVNINNVDSDNFIYESSMDNNDPHNDDPDHIVSDDSGSINAPNSFDEVPTNLPKNSKIRGSLSVCLKPGSVHEDCSLVESKNKLDESCDVCGKIFNSSSKLTKHKACHSKTFACKICEKSFAHLNDLIYHEKSVHEKGYSCKCCLCDMEFFTKEKVLEHQNEVHGDAKYRCNDCGRVFNRKSRLTDHISKHDEGAAIPCPYCGKKLSYQDTLKKHIRIYHKGPFKCKICDILFEDFETKRKHQTAKHRSQSTYLCITCREEFSDKKMLYQHRKNVHKDTYKCSECDKEFMNEYNLKQHKASHVSGTEVPMCQYCGKEFKTIKILHIHEKKQHLNPTGTKNVYLCEFCSKTFKSIDGLDSHVNVFHSDGESCKYQCNLCQKKFTREQHLHGHRELKHFGRSLHNCDVCGKPFSSDYNLRKHKVTLHSMLTYKCSDCSKSFSTQKELHKHSEIHDPLRPKSYFCDVCTSSFYSVSNLTQHKKIHDEKTKIYPCSYCEKKFREMRRLKKHLNVHKEDVSFLN